MCQNSTNKLCCCDCEAKYAGDTSSYWISNCRVCVGVKFDYIFDSVANITRVSEHYHDGNIIIREWDVLTIGDNYDFRLKRVCQILCCVYSHIAHHSAHCPDPIHAYLMPFDLIVASQYPEQLASSQIQVKLIRTESYFSYN